MGFRYCVDVSVKHVSVPSDIAHKFLDDFRTGILIDRFMSYLVLFRRLVNVLTYSLGIKNYNATRVDYNSPLYELKHVLCGRKIDVKHGVLKGEIHMFFKPYENEYRCNQLGVIISALVACCKISKCKECVEYAKNHIENYLSNTTDYNVTFTFMIKKNAMLGICVEVS